MQKDVISSPAVRHLVLPLVLLAAALAGLRAVGADEAIADHYFDPVTRTFPLQDDVWTEEVLHRGARKAVLAVGVTCLAITFLGKRRVSPATREAAVMMLGSIIACTATVAVLKAAVNLNCPWSYVRWGGQLPEVSDAPLLKLHGHDGAFPAGHAAGGFSLWILYFIGRRHSPAAARAGFAIALVTGAILGYSQVMRGAHFLSHNLWTAAICWILAARVDLLVPRRAP